MKEVNRAKYHLSSDTADVEECGLSCASYGKTVGFLNLKRMAPYTKGRLPCEAATAVCILAFMVLSSLWKEKPRAQMTRI